jgi:hypothetical protein
MDDDTRQVLAGFYSEVRRKDIYVTQVEAT